MVTEKKQIFDCNGIRLEQDFTPDDDGIFFWNADGFHDIDAIRDLIKTLQSMHDEIIEKRKDNPQT